MDNGKMGKASYKAYLFTHWASVAGVAYGADGALSLANAFPVYAAFPVYP